MKKTREERLEIALRENLKRRKTQERARESHIPKRPLEPEEKRG